MDGERGIGIDWMIEEEPKKLNNECRIMNVECKSLKTEDGRRKTPASEAEG